MQRVSWSTRMPNKIDVNLCDVEDHLLQCESYHVYIMKTDDTSLCGLQFSRNVFLCCVTFPR